tara:strand:+ start:50276 stop:51556 length:1281 start_codon:yes stop_codon:yes gene_type:complete
MSNTKQVGISRKRSDSQPTRNGYLGSKNLRFNHKASFGDVSFDLTALVNGIAGVQNPSPAQMANVYAYRNNLSISSSLGYELIPGQDYIMLGSIVTFLNDLADIGAQEDELFFGEILLPTSGVVTSESKYESTTTPLPIGQKLLGIGVTYEVNANAAQQTGSIKVYRNGKRQLRCVGNVLTGDGNYIEIDSGSGYGTFIQFKVANGSFEDSIVVDFGTHSVGDINVFSDIERLTGTIYQMAQDLADETGNPLSDYLTASASEVDRLTLSSTVSSNETRLDDLENVEYVEGTITTTATATADTYRDVSDSEIVLPSGEWELYLEGTMIGYNNSVSTISLYGNIGIFNDINEVQDKSLSLLVNQVVSGQYVSHVVSLKARVSGGTYKIRIRANVSTATGSYSIGATSFTGGLTNPDMQHKWYAKKIKS